MNHNPLFAAMLLVTALFQGGCMMPKGYIDPAFHTATYKDVTPAKTPIPLRVEYALYRSENDKPSGWETAIFEKKAARVLESTKVMQPDPEAKNTLKIALTDGVGIGEALAKGLATGVTFGLVGSHVVHHYTLVMTFNAADGKQFRGSYEHALHSTVGLKSAPAGMQPVSYSDAFDQIVEDLILRSLVDFQQWQKVQ